MYQAIVSKIKTTPHPNADKIQLGHCHGFQVIVGLDVNDGDLGVFFPTDGQISDDFCLANNLYPVYNEEGKKIGGGFIDPKHRRIRSQNFRGEKSEGFWVPISYFDYLPDVVLKENNTFTKLNDTPICNKYLNTATQKAIKSKNKKASKKETNFFPMHLETRPLKYEINKIPVGSTIYITEKMHGSSGRTAYSPNPKESTPTLKSRLKRVFKRVFNLESDKYQILTGTRRTIKETSRGSGFYKDEKFRFDSTDKVKDFLRKGEAIYYEIVGYAGNSPIMPSVDNSVVGKDFVKKFGKTTEWDYGCPKGESEIFVYNWMISNEDGFHYSYPWEYIQSRCKHFGIKVVPPLAKVNLIKTIEAGTEDAIDTYKLSTPNETINLTKTQLQKLVTYLTEDQFSTIDSHLREGVCLRVEKNGSLKSILKNKAYSFGQLEGYIKSNEDYVDTEEIESY